MLDVRALDLSRAKDVRVRRRACASLMTTEAVNELEVQKDSVRIDSTRETTMHCRLDHVCAGLRLNFWVLGVFVTVASSIALDVGMLPTRTLMNGLCMLRLSRHLDDHVSLRSHCFRE